MSKEVSAVLTLSYRFPWLLPFLGLIIAFLLSRRQAGVLCFVCTPKMALVETLERVLCKQYFFMASVFSSFLFLYGFVYHSVYGMLSSAHHAGLRVSNNFRQFFSAGNSEKKFMRSVYKIFFMVFDTRNPV